MFKKQLGSAIVLQLLGPPGFVCNVQLRNVESGPLEVSVPAHRFALLDVSVQDGQQGLRRIVKNYRHVLPLPQLESLELHNLDLKSGDTNIYQGPCSRTLNTLF
uniref:Uncharacterized protein n=1 Tax=Ditylenchus dipsaci TaxID=166011 RepID=A0A915CUM7_9BILA